MVKIPQIFLKAVNTVGCSFENIWKAFDSFDNNDTTDWQNLSFILLESKITEHNLFDFITSKLLFSQKVTKCSTLEMKFLNKT